MTTLNAYANLREYKDYVRSRGGEVRDDVTDDLVIEFLLKSASRYLDSATGRTFNPFVETRYYDVPSVDSVDPRELKLDGDLLEIITLTNGDDTVIPSTEYNLRPKNSSPHYGIRLVNNSTYSWSGDSAGDMHDVISVSGFWGFHNRYSLAWALGSTASEAMDASETGYDVADSSPFVVGDLIKFDNEIGYVSSLASTNSLTTTRGENGSTAATHLTGINVYIWRVMEEAKNACIEIANSAYQRRFGKSTGESVQITAAGVVLSPKDIPSTAAEFIRIYRRYD